MFVIDANANPPQQLAGSDGFYAQVGTVIFNMAVNPASGKLYVSNTDTNNLIRFEGSGQFGGSTVRGDIVQSRISVLDSAVTTINLNKHVDHDICCEATPNATNDKSLAFPMGMAVSADGKTLYVTAFGSDKIGVFDTAELEQNTFVPDAGTHIEISGGGPTDIVIDTARERAYVATRFDNGISIVDLKEQRETQHIGMYNPEPPSIVEGRRFLYDARLSSGNGTQACASCHIFGDMDQLAWDLGDPDTGELKNPGPFLLHPDDEIAIRPPGVPPINPNFASMKGPMTTQSLRGMANHGPMHWRGDRTGGREQASVQPDGGSFSEELAFKAFNVAFPGLNGRHDELAAAQMEAFTKFALQITYPPNPIRNLDNSLTPQQQAGKDFFTGPVSDSFFTCEGCHVLNPDGNAEFGVFRPGFFGSDGHYTAVGAQMLKVPHLRNMYQKVGTFGIAEFSPVLPPPGPDPFPHMGDQIHGFGFLHGGDAPSLFTFMTALGFAKRPPGVIRPEDPGNPGGFEMDFNDPDRRAVEAFILAFDSNLAPIVGQQITLGPANALHVADRIDLLIERAAAGECDLVAHADGSGYLYAPDTGSFIVDDSRVSPLSLKQLTSDVESGDDAITFTCMPPGSGVRAALDRDEDGVFDADELRPIDKL